MHSHNAFGLCIPSRKRNAMIYELWYEDSPNIIDAFTTEAEALAEVRAYIEDYGPSSIDMMALLAAPQGREKYIVARGAQLAKRATTSQAHPRTAAM